MDPVSMRMLGDTGCYIDWLMAGAQLQQLWRAGMTSPSCTALPQANWHSSNSCNYQECLYPPRSLQRCLLCSGSGSHSCPHLFVLLHWSACETATKLCLQQDLWSHLSAGHTSQCLEGSVAPPSACKFLTSLRACIDAVRHEGVLLYVWDKVLVSLL